RCGDHSANARRASWRDCSFRDDLELVASLEVAAHVDAIFVDIRERPGELLSSGRRELIARTRVHRGIEIRLDLTADDDRVGCPRKPLFDAGPGISRSAKMQ